MTYPPDEFESLEIRYDLRLFLRLFAFLRPYLLPFLLVLLLSLFSAGLELALPYITKEAIDQKILKHADVISYPGEEEARQKLRAIPEAIFLPPRSILIPTGSHRASADARNSVSSYYLYKRDLPPEEWEALISKVKSVPTAFFTQDILVIPYADLKNLSSSDVWFLRKNDYRGLLFLSMLFLLFLIGNFFVNVYLAVILQWIGQGVIQNIRLTLLNHLMNLSISFFTRNPVGRLVTRLTNDAEALSEFFTLVLVTFFKDIFFVAGILFVLLHFNWRLSLWILILAPFLLVIALIFRAKAWSANRVIRRKIAEINAYLSESLSGIRVIKLFLREKVNQTRFQRLNREAYQANMRQILLFSSFHPFINFLSYLAVGLVMYFGGHQVIRGELTVGSLVAFFAYTQMFFAPIADLAEKYNVLQSAMAAAEKIFSLLDVKEFIPESPAGKIPEHLQGEVVFQNVSHTYDGIMDVLRDVSFRVKPGQTVALVGPTGAGKTTITNLLLRFYDPVRGRILIDGVDIRDIPQKSLRSFMAIVTQDVFLFSTDILQNIRLNRKSITVEQARSAAEAVGASHFIHSLPRQYDEPVQERGATLSVGQKQLLVFARAFAFNPKILILDEATSSVDPDTEKHIQEALKLLLKGRTSFVIAHRLSTIKNADKILVLHKGRIVEEGTHSSLLEKQGFYYNLYRLQFPEERNPL